MNPDSAAGMGIRMACAFLLCAALVIAAPAVWLVPVSPLVGAAIDASSPYLESSVVYVDGRVVHGRTQIHLDLKLANGVPVGAVSSTWDKECWQTLGILVVATAIWACPPAGGFRRRLALFPVMLAAAACVSAYDLAIDIQETLLWVPGLESEWLSHLPVAADTANQSVLSHLNSWHEGIRWIRKFNDAGGRLILAILAGLIGHAIPFRCRTLPGGI